MGKDKGVSGREAAVLVEAAQKAARRQGTSLGSGRMWAGSQTHKW